MLQASWLTVRVLGMTDSCHRIQLGFFFPSQGLTVYTWLAWNFVVDQVNFELTETYLLCWD